MKHKEETMLKKSFQRWASLGMVFALLVGLLPALPAAAETGNPVTITSPYTPTEDDLTKPDLLDAKIPRYTSSPIDVVATVSSDQISRLNEMYYEVYNETTKDTKVFTANKAQQTGPFDITFHDVALTEGKNRITIKVGVGSVVTSQPAYAYYVPVSNITDLKIDGEPLENNKILPTNPKQSLMITGLAPNANEVKAYVNTNQEPNYAVVRNGQFTFFAEDITLPPSRQTTSFDLTPGDNHLIIQARNNTNTYNSERDFIYDNGQPFAFQVNFQELDNSGAPVAGTTPLPLNQLTTYTPTLDASNGMVRLTANLKVDNADTVTNYTYGILHINGGSLNGGEDLRYDFGGTGSLTELPNWSSSRYKVYSYSKDFVLSDLYNQSVDFDFVDEDHGQKVTSSFKFTYEKKNAASIKSTVRVVGGAKIALSPSPTRNQITERPLKLEVTTSNTDSLNLYLGDSATQKENNIDYPIVKGATDAATGLTVFTVDLTKIPDGSTKLILVPVSSGNENLNGRRSYEINVSGVPYLIVNNLFTGMVVKSASDPMLTGPSLSGIYVSGRAVNLPEIEFANAKLYLNGVEVTKGTSASVAGATTFNGSISKDTSDALKDNYGTFKFAMDPTDYKLQEGKNTIKFVLFLKGQPVTETSYDIFLFSKEAPNFLNLKVTPDNQLGGSIKELKADTYITNEAYVRLSGQISSTTGMSITVRKQDAQGKPITTYDKIATINGGHQADIRSEDISVKEQTNTSSYYYIKNLISPPASGGVTTPGSFDTYLIKLKPNGDTIIELEIKNVTGVSTMRTITISRSPLPYMVRVPQTVKNAKGEDQANINGNFVDIELVAEGADSIVFGKDTVYRDGSDSTIDLFKYRAKGLKAGINTIKFTVNRGTTKQTGSFVVFNADTPIEGAQYLATMSSKFKVFDGDLELSFPKDTLLMRNKPGDVNPSLTAGRQILFGIADSVDGRVDKQKNPVSKDIPRNYTRLYDREVQQGTFLLNEQTGRFRPASKLYWVDAGTIKDRFTYMDDLAYLNEVQNGSGRLPYDTEEFYSRLVNDQVVPTQRGTLTLKFDPNIRNDAWKYVTVMHFYTMIDYKGNAIPQWENVGGVVNNSNNTIQVPFDSFGYYQVMYMHKSFDDVTAHPARDELDTLYSKGIMKKSNRNDAAFSPNIPITRGEFVTLLVKIFKLPMNYDGAGTFSDVYKEDPFSDGLYEYKNIETAARAGIVRGTTNGTFSPSMSITRQDAAVMIARANESKLGTDEKKVTESLIKLFFDAANIDPHARASVEAITKAKLIEGKENALQDGQKKATVSFDPQGSLTRAQAAIIAMRVMKQQGQVPK